MFEARDERDRSKRRRSRRCSMTTTSSTADPRVARTQVPREPIHPCVYKGFLAKSKVRLLGRYLNSKTEVERISHLCKRAASQRVERVSYTTVRGSARLTKRQNDEIVALYKVGRRPADIARELGTSEWTVHHRLNRLGVQRRPISMTSAEVQEAVQLNDAGIPITELTKRFNRSWKTIAKELKDARAQGSRSS
jgi:DNA-binding CsgD family transcriptional regulator